MLNLGFLMAAIVRPYEEHGRCAWLLWPGNLPKARVISRRSQSSVFLMECPLLCSSAGGGEVHFV